MRKQNYDPSQQGLENISGEELVLAGAILEKNSPTELREEADVSNLIGPKTLDLHYSFRKRFM